LNYLIKLINHHYLGLLPAGLTLSLLSPRYLPSCLQAISTSLGDSNSTKATPLNLPS